jgi:hypothetical protein
MTRTGIPLRPLAVICVLSVLLSGCHSSDGSGPKLAPVSGRVVFKNEAVTAASIFFIPDKDKGNRGDQATAVLQLDGSFKMETNPNRNGVVPGSYKVIFDLGRRSDKELQPYRKVETTPLSIDVPEQGLENYLIELK